MWWAWALVLVALLIVVTMSLRRRGASGNVRREDLPAHQRVDQNDSNPNTTLGSTSFGGM